MGTRKHACGRLSVLLFLVLAVVGVSMVHAFTPPKYAGMVTDLTSTLSSDDRTALEHKLTAYRDSTTNEIAVLIVSSLNGVAKEDFGHDTFNAWGIGKKSKDNGVLFLIAMEEHETRIDVGYGLEGQLTDLLVTRLQDRRHSVMTEKFRQGDFAGGINAVVDGMIAIIGGDSNPPALQAEESSSGSLGAILLIIIILLVVLLVFGAVAGGLDGSSSGGGFISGGGGGGDSGGGFSFGGGSCGGGGGGGGW